MDAKDLIKAGRLSDARATLTGELKLFPSNVSARVLLFQVLCFFGEWDRAIHQLEVIVSRETRSETGVQLYKNLVLAEKERSEVMRFQGQPSCLPESPPHLGTHVEACRSLMGGNVEHARDLFDQLETNRAPLQGTLDGRPFTGFTESDSFLCVFFEAFVHHRYFWIPFDRVKEMIIVPPQTLFDLLWIPARITTRDDTTVGCHLPVLYPATCTHEDDRVKLGRVTDWRPLGDSFLKGYGQHVYKAGEEEAALLEMRTLTFDHSPEEAES